MEIPASPKEGGCENHQTIPWGYATRERTVVLRDVWNFVKHLAVLAAIGSPWKCFPSDLNYSAFEDSIKSSINTDLT